MLSDRPSQCLVVATNPLVASFPLNSCLVSTCDKLFFLLIPETLLSQLLVANHDIQRFVDREF